MATSRSSRKSITKETKELAVMVDTFVRSCRHWNWKQVYDELELENRQIVTHDFALGYKVKDFEFIIFQSSHSYNWRYNGNVT